MSDETPVTFDPNNGLPPIYEEKIVLNKETGKSLIDRKLELINLVKNSIDDEKYFIGWWDEFYIPETQFYHSFNFSHDYCIIGYDDCCFYCAGYYSGYPKVITVTYNDFFEANEALTINHALLWKRNPNYIFNFDLNLVIRGLESYITGKVPNTEKRDYSSHVFGKNVLLKLSEMIEKNNCVDIRFIHTIKQQKLLMKMRVEYIYNLYNFSDSNELEVINSIYQQIQHIFNLCLKLNLTGESYISSKISRKLNDIVASEEKIYPVLECKFKHILDNK
ncbi:MAG: hypothetical protein E7652_00060 [Ruminococcaceae bacterium]|nr:hypothetical protein [Oscillospiraceae bacterium]